MNVPCLASAPSSSQATPQTSGLCEHSRDLDPCSAVKLCGVYHGVCLALCHRLYCCRSVCVVQGSSSLVCSAAIARTQDQGPRYHLPRGVSSSPLPQRSFQASPSSSPPSRRVAESAAIPRGRELCVPRNPERWGETGVIETCFVSRGRRGRKPFRGFQRWNGGKVSALLWHCDNVIERFFISFMGSFPFGERFVVLHNYLV